MRLKCGAEKNSMTEGNANGARRDLCRCTGECCTRFSLKFTPSQVRDALRGVGPVCVEDKEEIRLIHSMLIPLKIQENRTGTWYRCRHFNRKWRRCGIYEKRPGFCRAYGTEHTKCQHPRCRWKDAVHTSDSVEKKEIACEKND